MTSEYHAYPFSVHGYNDWRNVIIAKALTSDGDRILEIGANVGTETVGFSDIVGRSGEVHAFEPLPSNLSILDELASCSENQNIVVHPYAISDSNRTSNFHVPPLHQSGIGHLIHYDQPETETIKVDCRKLDSIAKDIGPPNVIFIDAEGEEVRILRGGKEYIKLSHPTIVLEASAKLLRRAGSSLDILYEEMEGLGYSPYQISRLGLRKVDSNNMRSFGNWVCVYSNENENSTVSKIRRFILFGGILPCIPGLNPLTSV
jgi:FkbM family methyltransferase